MKCSFNQSIFFSFICVTYNNYEQLIMTLKSLELQKFKSFEVLIGNGGEYLKLEKIQSEITLNNLTLINEKDKGIYDAMNNLKCYVRGEYVCYLNSGDTLVDKNTLNYIYKSIINFPNHTNFPLVWCSANFISHCSKVSYQVPNPAIINLRYLKNWIRFMNFYLCHQACFIRFDYIKDYLYDEWDLEADYKLKKTLLKNKNGSIYIPIISSNYYLDGISSNINNVKLFLQHFSQLRNYSPYKRIFIFFKLVLKFIIEIFSSENRHYYKLIKYKFSDYFVRLISKLLDSKKYK